MGRLFWKFFFAIWLAQLAAGLATGTIFWLRHQSQNAWLPDLDGSPPAAFDIEAAAAILQYGGPDALRGLAGSAARVPVYAVDESDREILGRSMPPATIEHARAVAGSEGRAHTVRQVSAMDGHTYTLFVPRSEKHAGGRPPPDGRRPPPDRGFHIPLLPGALAMLASLISAALLAWHFSRPIRNLRLACEAVAQGNMQTRVGAMMNNRGDELGDLGRDFDRMAGRLHASMAGQRRLLHDVSHELRSPLARLQAAVGLARQKPEKWEATLERIERESVRIDGLVGQLLSLSRLEEGAGASGGQDINIGELMAEIVEDARFEAAANGKHVVLSGNCDAIVRGQAELLHSAIENVIRNAVRHTAQGGSVIVRAAADSAGGSLRIVIEDEGPGVPEQELEAIFEPFFRGSGADKSADKSADGHGLGLAIARRIVEAHHGKIRAFNRSGKGLCVDIALPAATAASCAVG